MKCRQYVVKKLSEGADIGRGQSKEGYDARKYEVHKKKIPAGTFLLLSFAALEPRDWPPKICVRKVSCSQEGMIYTIIAARKIICLLFAPIVFSVSSKGSVNTASLAYKYLKVSSTRSCG